MRARTALPLAAALLWGAAAEPAAAERTLARMGDRATIGNVRLSNERTLTRWAHVAIPSRIRRRPSTRSKSIDRLRFQTEDGPLEVYLVLRTHRAPNERLWFKIRVPGRPNGRTGWVPHNALGPLNLVRTHLRVNRTTLRATLYRRGRKVWQSPIGVGKASTPTPGGRYWVRERLRALGGIYGPWAFGTAAYSRLSEWPGGGVIGIHGTNQPELIPGRVSHGCIRVPNDRIVGLVRLMPIGTPVRIV